jgi:hypothetical protein
VLGQSGVGSGVGDRRSLLRSPFGVRCRS